MTDGNQPIDPVLRLFVDIAGMSSDLRVQHYLQVLLVRNETRLKFQIMGNLAVTKRIIKLPNGTVLEPHQTEKEISKRISEMTSEELRQFWEREYVIDGYIDIELRKKEEIAQQLTSVVEQIERSVNLMSFLAGAKLRWVPSQLVSDKKGDSILIPVPLEPRESVHSSEHIASFIAFSKLIESLPETERVDLYRAIDWYQQGINSSSVFNQFLSFWLAIETMARSLYPRVRDKSGKTQIQNAFRKLWGKEAEEKIGRCFGKKEPLIDIRIDIAHGIISESDTRQKSRVEKCVYEIQRLAKEFLLNTLITKST